MIISRLLKPGFYLLIAILLMASQITGCSTEERAEALAGNEILVPEVPVPTPTSTPTPWGAMFSYRADLSNAQPLSGAVLEQRTVYMFFANTTKYSSMNFYCCKGIGGASKGEGHNAAVRSSSAPFVYSIDLRQYSTSGKRELYVDATRANDNGLDNIFVNFTINITPTLVPIPTASDVNLSWTAPAEREDNQPMSLSDIAGYKVYYGITQGNYNNSVDINDGSATGHTFKDFTSGTYYFVVTTFDVDGRESQYSTPVQINI